MQFGKCLIQSGEIFVIRDDHNIAVATKLGRAVEHAGLSAHKQVPHPVVGNRCKDFEDRVRDQVSPLP